jgi:hypothetical protein
MQVGGGGAGVGGVGPGAWGSGGRGGRRGWLLAEDAACRRQQLCCVALPS